MGGPSTLTATMDISKGFAGVIENVIVRRNMDDDGFINVPLKSSLSVDKGEELEVGVIKMGNSKFPNVYNEDRKLSFSWELSEYLDGSLTGVTPLGHFEIPTGYYRSVAELLQVMVCMPPSKHLDADASKMRKEMMLNISEMVKVESTERITRISLDSEKSLELFSEDRVNAFLKFRISQELLDLIKRTSGNTTSHVMLLTMGLSSKVYFDTHSSRVHEEPMCHLMMDKLQEAMVDGKSKPILFSFPQHEIKHEPLAPRFALYKVDRMGSRGEVKSLRLWLESETGEKIILPKGKRSFHIHLQWWKRHG